MEILFARHAIAEDAETVGGSDSQRPLTAKGRKQFRALAEWLVEHGQAPELVLSSPLVRAVQTAEILVQAARLASEALRVDDLVAPGIDPQQLADFLRGLNVARIAVVGHEPDMSECTAAFIGGGRLHFGKGTVGCVEFDRPPEVGAGRLRWQVSPKLLKAGA